MTDPVLLAAPFPAPPGIIATVLDELRIAAAATDETEHEGRRVALLPRPWEPVGLPARDPPQRVRLARRGGGLDQ